MKKKSTSKSAFFNLRVLIASVLCLFGVFVALMGSGAFAQAKRTKNNQSATNQDAPGTQTPEVGQLVGPVRMNTDLRDLPYIPPAPRIVGAPLKRFPPTGGPPPETSAYPQ